MNVKCQRNKHINKCMLLGESLIFVVVAVKYTNIETIKIIGFIINVYSIRNVLFYLFVSEIGNENK